MFFTEIANQKLLKHERILDTQYNTVVSEINQKHTSIYIVSVGNTIQYSNVFRSRTDVSSFGA